MGAALVAAINSAHTPTPPTTPAATTAADSKTAADSRTQEEKAAESAKYLKADVPSIGQPTWNYRSWANSYANITGADGKEYYFVPDDFAQKGSVYEGEQIYNKRFVDPATFKTAIQYTLPKGMQSVMSNNGYVWAADDFKKLGLDQTSSYKIDANNPAILGIGTPHASMGQGSTIAYITQPKLAPGGERVQQDWITAADGRLGGLGEYSYYKYQGPFADALRKGLKDLGPLTPLLFDIFGAPGAGQIYLMSRAAGEAAITGDWNKAATTIGTIMASSYVASSVSDVVGGSLDLGKVANSIIGNATGNAAVAGLTGGDPVAAFVNSGVGGAVGAITGKIDGFNELPASVQKVFNATLRAELTGKDPTKAAILAATTAGLQAIKNGMDANDRFQKNYGRQATPEELNNFAYVSTPEELNKSFEKYMQKTADDTAAEAAARQAAIDEQDRLDAESRAREEAEAAARQVAIDEQNRLDEIEANRKANDEAERLRLAGLEENKDVDLNKIVDTTTDTTKPTDVITNNTGDDNVLGATNTDTIAGSTAIDTVAGGTGADTLTGGADTVTGGADVVNNLTKAGLQENTGDLTKIVGGSDTATGGTGTDTLTGGADDGTAMGDVETDDEAQARRVAEFGKDLTGGGVQDLGDVDTDTEFYDENSTGMGAYKYDATSGTYTYTSDDGSTLTLDGDGNIVSFTEATDTPWTGITDTQTGNLKLPKLPGGVTPTVKPPAKKPAVITGAGTSTVAPGGNTAIASGGGTSVQTGGGLNMAALLAIMGGMGGNQQQQPEIQLFDPNQDAGYFDWESDPFAPKTKDKTNPTGQPKMAGGGSIDEILDILRRSGI